MPKKLIVANWKMNLSPKNSLEFLRKLKTYNFKLKTFELVICPSFLSLPEIKSLIPDFKFLIHVGAQDCFWAERGAYTGEISPADLREIGCKYVIIGHSERRQYLKETDEMINFKLKAALSAGLVPIFCLGESQSERDRGQAESRVRIQLKAGLTGISLKKNQKIFIAYEPVWAIGTGKFCPPNEAVRMHHLIKKEAGRFLKIKNVPVLYGGSVDDKNVADYLKQEEVDGVLVGGASAKADIFLSLLRKIGRSKD